MNQVSDDKEGPGSVFQQHIVDVSVLLSFRALSALTSLSYLQAEVLITTPFHPGYLTRELIEKVQY